MSIPPCSIWKIVKSATTDLTEGKEKLFRDQEGINSILQKVPSSASDSYFILTRHLGIGCCSEELSN